jgi:signal transduction histidine kinase
MVSNLVMNALLHGFPDNATGRIRLAAERRGAGIVFELGDDGIGIAAENIGRIFDPFFTTKRGQGGSGLGLHIVYNLITSTLRGRVTVDSAPGRGTRFVIDLPDTRQKTTA